jgi:hypothetical protein
MSILHRRPEWVGVLHERHARLLPSANEKKILQDSPFISLNDQQIGRGKQKVKMIGKQCKCTCVRLRILGKAIKTD